MKRGLRNTFWIIIILIILILIAFPKFKNLHKRNNLPSGGLYSAAVVRVMVAIPEKLREVIKTTGSIIPDEEVNLSFETSGKIKAIYFKEGTRVKKGDLLAKLNDLDLLAQLDKLRIQEKLAQEKELRERTLLTKEAVSQESYDQVKSDLLGIESEIKLLQVRIAETEIHSPFDGIVGLRYVSEGAFVTQSTLIALLVKNRPLKIDFSIPERYAGLVKPGTELTFTIEQSDKKYLAKTYAVEPKIDPKTRTIAVRAVYDNLGEELLPGRFVTIELVIREVDSALQVPTESIIPELGGEKVFLVRGGKAQSSAVKTGLRTESNIEITDGINAGDTVVTSGILQLRNDMPVTIESYKKQ